MGDWRGVKGLFLMRLVSYTIFDAGPKVIWPCRHFLVSKHKFKGIHIYFGVFEFFFVHQLLDELGDQSE